MRKWFYRKRRYNHKEFFLLAVLGLFILLYIIRNFWQLLVIGAVIVFIIFIVKFYFSKNKARDKEAYVDHNASTEEIRNNRATYKSKMSIMTDCEKAYYDVIKRIVPPQYTVQPQINLASVISKESHSRYRNELFRNIDFGIFDEKFNLIILIEVNDLTHNLSERKYRDNKVKRICDEANIPLVTFWTKYGIDEQYIRSRISEHIPQCNNNYQSI